MTLKELRSMLTSANKVAGTNDDTEVVFVVDGKKLQATAATHCNAVQKDRSVKPVIEIILDTPVKT